MDFRQYLLLEEAAEILRETDILFLETESVEPTRDRLKYIDPLTRKNWRHADKWRQLAAIVNHEARKAKNPTPADRIWVTFSDVPRLGMPQHIRSGKTTPYGVFAYPAPYVLKQASGGGIPYAGDRAYIIVFKVKENMAEVGHSSDTHDRYSAKMKGPLKDTFHQSVSNSLEKKRVKLVNWLDQWNYNSKKGKGQPKQELHDIARSMLDKVIQKLKSDSYNYPDGLEAAKVLNQTNIEQMFNPQEIKQQKADQAKQNLQQFIQGLNYDYGYQMKYHNVGDDMSAELTDDFKKWVLEPGREYYYPMLKEFGENKQAELEGRKPLDWLVKFDKQAFGSSYSYGQKYLKAWREAVPQEGVQSPYDSPYLKKITDFMVKQIRRTLEKYHETPFDKVNYPMKPELNMIAQQFGADVKSAVETAMGNAENGKQFLYRATEAMAKEVAGSRPWQLIWNKMLRLIGWDHAVDTHHSGHVHSSEPTQGVFMDTSKVEQIGLIVNKAFVNDPDQSQRPDLGKGKGGWTPYDDTGGTETKLRSGLHSRTQGPILNRKGPAAGGAGNPMKGRSAYGTGYTATAPNTTGKTALQRTLMNLNYRLEQFSSALPSLGRLPHDQLAGWMNMLVKLLKTVRNLRDSVNKMPEPEPGYLFSDKPTVAERRSIQPHVKKMDTLLNRIKQAAEQIKATAKPSSAVTAQMIDSVIKLASVDSEGMETPHFDRPFWKTPAFKAEFKPTAGGATPGGASLAVLKSKTATGAGYYVQQSLVDENGDSETYFGPFVTQTGAITACVLCGQEDWKHYWNDITYWGSYDLGEAKSNGAKIKGPEEMTMKTPATPEEVKQMKSEIEGEAQSEGYM